MDKFILPFLGFVGGLITWAFPSVPWYWKLIITLIILLLVSVLYVFSFFQKNRQLTDGIFDKEARVSDLKNQLTKWEKDFKQEERDRKNVARMYGSCERDSEKFIIDIREARSDLHKVYIFFNQNKTRRDAHLVEEIERIIKTIDSIVERENKHARERSISSN